MALATKATVCPIAHVQSPLTEVAHELLYQPPLNPTLQPRFPSCRRRSATTSFASANKDVVGAPSRTMTWGDRC
jgi:hypothetical protein